MSISTVLPLWYNIFCIMLSLAVVVFLYRKAQRFSELSLMQRLIPALLRGVVVWLLAFLLLEPLFKYEEVITEQPIVLVATDQSRSMKSDSLRIREIMEYWSAQAQDQKEYEFQFVNFDGKVNEVKDPSISSLANGNSTSISGVVRYINDNYQYRNLGAVIIMTDGIYNNGLNPLYEKGLQLAPIYTIGFGDTAKYSDAVLSDIKYNKIVGLNVTSPVQVSVNTFGLNRAQAKVILEVDNQVKDSYAFLVDGDEAFEKVQFNVDFDTPGLKKMRLRLETNQDEFRYDNNTIDFFVEVKDVKKRVLLLAAAPHPDLASMMNALGGNLNVACDLKYWNGNSIDYQNYDVVILHQLPSKQLPVGDLKGLIDSDKALFFVLGEKTDLRKLAAIQSWVGLATTASGMEEVLPVLNRDYQSFRLEAGVREAFEDQRPFLKPYATYNVPSNADVLLYQQIGAIQTPYPLLFTLEETNKYTAFLLGEGWWLNRLASAKRDAGENAVDALFNKLIIYLSQQQNRERLKVTAGSKYQIGETVKLSALYYNASYESVNDQALNLILKDEAGNEFDYAFVPSGDRYQLEIKGLPAGLYQYEVSVVGQPAIRQTGAFGLEDLGIEDKETRANHTLLRQISQASGGLYQNASDFESWNALNNAAESKLKTVSYVDSLFKRMIQFKQLFYLLMLLLTAEWLYRKALGMI